MSAVLALVVLTVCAVSVVAAVACCRMASLATAAERRQREEALRQWAHPHWIDNVDNWQRDLDVAAERRRQEAAEFDRWIRLT